MCINNPVECVLKPEYMIYNQWYVILESKELKSRHPLRIKRFSENLVLWRDENNEVSCIADECCHRGASLSCGKIIKGKLECPFHDFIYDKSGIVKVIPANGKNKPERWTNGLLLAINQSLSTESTGRNLSMGAKKIHICKARYV